MGAGIADVGHQPRGLHHVDLQGAISLKKNGPVMNTGPVEAGQGGNNDDQQVRAYLRTQECAPKGANPEKMFDARDLPRLCPPHTPQARVEPGPRGGIARGAGRAPETAVEPSDLSPIRSTSLSLLCLRTGGNVSPEVQRVLRVILRVHHAFTRDCAGCRTGGSGTFSLRFVFDAEFSFFAIVKSAAAQRRQAFDRTTPAR